MGVSEDSDTFENLKIYSNVDEHMNKLGLILSTPKSRKIYVLLITKELSLTQIDKIIGIRGNPKLPSIVYHLNKMVEVKLVKTRKAKIKSGGESTYYRAAPLILIVPEHNYVKAIKSKTLKNILKKIFKSKV